jgi:hypothetical protein
MEDKSEINLELSKKILSDEDKKKIIEKTYDIYSDESVVFSEKKDVSKKTSSHKKINFDVTSIENLTPELQESIKRLLISNNTKSEVSKLIKEIEIEKNKFLKKQDGLFGRMNEKEMEILERKLAETEVNQEVTEVNLTAIVSCLNNMMIK